MCCVDTLISATRCCWELGSKVLLSKSRPFGHLSATGRPDSALSTLPPHCSESPALLAHVCDSILSFGNAFSSEQSWLESASTIEDIDSFSPEVVPLSSTCSWDTRFNGSFLPGCGTLAGKTGPGLVSSVSSGWWIVSRPSYPADLLSDQKWSRARYWTNHQPGRLVMQTRN